MIDESILKDVLIKNYYNLEANHKTSSIVFSSEDECIELIQLARIGLEFEEFKKSRSHFNGWANWKHLVELGLWAREYGIPCIKKYRQNTSYDFGGKALSKLPKGVG